MIVKSETDALRFIEEEGHCGTGGEFCSQSCEKHGKHVAVGANGKVFAVGCSREAILAVRSIRNIRDLAKAA